MTTLLILFGCLVAGALLNAYFAKAAVLTSVARTWVIYVALPAVILKEIPVMSFGSDTWLALLGGLWVFGGSVVFLWSCGKWLGWSRATIACLILTAGLGNTSFVGLPAIRLLVGEIGIGPALVFDQVGSFLPLAIGGALAVSWGQGENVDWWNVLKKLATFPPTLALGAALVLGADMLSPVLPALSLAAKTLSPVALLAVGLSTSMTRISNIRELGLGLVWKLLLAPLGVLGLAHALGTGDLWTQTTVLQAGMAPMVTGGIVAASAGLEPALASRMVVVGLFISVLTLPLWNLLLG